MLLPLFDISSGRSVKERGRGAQLEPRTTLEAVPVVLPDGLYAAEAASCERWSCARRFTWPAGARALRSQLQVRLCLKERGF